MKKIIAMLLACLMVVGMFAACGSSDKPTEATKAPETTAAPTEAAPEVTDVTLKVWAPQEDQVDANSWLSVMLARFAENHPEYNITWDIGVCSEGDARELVTTDAAAAADVYLYANDQIGDLLNAGALSKLGGSFLEQVQNDVSTTYVNTVTGVDGGVYGFPIGCNTWFMYYNKSVFTEEDVKSIEAMLEKGVVAFPMTTAWYTGSFFMANGGKLFGDAGVDGSAGIQFGGQAGYDAAAKMVELMANPNFKNDADGLGNSGLKDGSVAAYFSGDWDFGPLYEALGDDLGAVSLPTANIGGNDISMRSFAGSKAVGVNPNASNPKVAMELAAFLASEEGQLLRFELRGITPAVTSLGENEAVKTSMIAAAQNATMANTSVAQPSIAEMGSYWGPMETFGNNIVSGSVNAGNIQESVDALMESLNNAGL